MRLIIQPILACLLFFSFSLAANAAPQAQLWKYWDANASENKESIDHSAFTRILGEYVKSGGELGLNRFDYAGISGADKKALKDYINTLEGIEITAYSRAEQRPYWINLYNAVTLEVVLDNYPVDSIREIGGSLFSGGPWDEKLITVEGKKLTLNDIEHRILRPIWPGPLTHYGVNCASIGCPNLLTEAYTAENLEDALRANAKAYINSPRGVRFEDGGLQASKIYDWFSVDFGKSPTAVISHLRQFAEPALSAKLDAADGFDSYYYDWSLNGVK